MFVCTDAWRVLEQGGHRAFFRYRLHRKRKVNLQSSEGHVLSMSRKKLRPVPELGANSVASRDWRV